MHIQKMTLECTGGKIISWTYPDDVQFDGLSMDDVRALMTDCMSPVVHDPAHAIAEVMADATDSCP